MGKESVQRPGVKYGGWFCKAWNMESEIKRWRDGGGGSQVIKGITRKSGPYPEGRRDLLEEILGITWSDLGTALWGEETHRKQRDPWFLAWGGGAAGHS